MNPFKITLTPMLACAFFVCAGEVIFAATPKEAALARAGSDFPPLEAQAVFPGLLSPAASSVLKAVSAAASAHLAWMVEGERRRYFPDQDPDTLLVELESRVKLACPGAGGNFELGLPEPESGYYLGLSVSASGEAGSWEVFPLSQLEFLEAAGEPRLESLSSTRKNGMPVLTERWFSGGGEEARGRRPCTQMGGQIYARVYAFSLKMEAGQERELRLRYYSFLHRQQNPSLNAPTPGLGGLPRMGAGKSPWGRTKRGAGKAGYFSLWLCGPLASLNPSGQGCFALDLDLGRSVAARWRKTLPLKMKTTKGQWVHYAGSLDKLEDLRVSLSDAVLAHYPPMSLKQKKVSSDLVEQAARDCGRP